MKCLFLDYKVSILALGIVNFILGAWFLLWSSSLIRLNDALKRWFSTDHFSLALNRMRDLDTSIMRMRHLFGLAAVVVAGVLIYLYIKG